MTGSTGRHVVRIVTALVISLSLALPALMDDPDPLPDVALGSASILYFERVLLVLVVLLLTSTVLIRGVGFGDLPTSISREGFTWKDELISTTDQIADELQAQIDALALQVREVAEFVARPE
jgi:hypothetical protein